MSPAGRIRRAREPVQVRYATDLTSEEYVRREAWSEARLSTCPFGNEPCGAVGHGTYGRVCPPGTRVARLWCERCGVSIGLLPDCLASRVSGTLERIEDVALEVEEGRGVERTANEKRPDAIELPGAVRWVRRRSRWVREIVTIIVTLVGDELKGCAPKIVAVRECLGLEDGLLQHLRELAQRHLHALPPPLGLVPSPGAVGQCVSAYPQPKGPDPPRISR